MTDLLQSAVTWLRGVREAHMSRTVTYRRGSTTAALTATVGQTMFRIGTDYGADMIVRMRDYVISAAALTAAGFGEPEDGDEIDETVGSTVYTFEAMGPGNGEPSWRWSDPDRQQVRVHTKQTAEAAV